MSRPSLRSVDGEGVAVLSGLEAVHLVGLEADAQFFARQEIEGLFEVGAQFIGGACPARIVASHLAAAREGVAGVVEADDVVALPGVQTQGDFGEFGEHGLGVHAVLAIHFFGEGVEFF